MRIQNKSPFKPKLEPGYRIEAKSEEATVYLYDEIGWFGIPAEQFVKDLNSIKSGVINLRVNSPGGSVFDGTTIFNAIKQHKSKVIAHVDGLAASITSVIVMAADEVRMAENAFMMIHEPWSIVIGNAEGMRHEAELLDKVAGVISKAYMDKSGKDAEEINTMMNYETWMTAQEALEAGFVDSIYDEKLDKAEVTLFDLSVFNKVPDQLQQTQGMPTQREIEQLLRNAGCSQKQAKSILAAGYDSLQRDAVDQSDQQEVKAQTQRDVDKAPDQPEAQPQRDVEAVKQLEVDPTTLLLAKGDVIIRTLTT